MESEGAINSGQYAWGDEGPPLDDRNLVVRYASHGVEQFTPEQVEAARRHANPRMPRRREPNACSTGEHPSPGAASTIARRFRPSPAAVSVYLSSLAAAGEAL